MPEPNFCDQCRHFLDVPGKSYGRCLHLEESAHEGLRQLAVLTKCTIHAMRHGSDDACDEFQSTLPDEIMGHILDNDREEQRRPL
jgi:hypothetical protein